MPRPRCLAMISASWCRRRKRNGWRRGTVPVAAAARAEEAMAMEAAHGSPRARDHMSYAVGTRQQPERACHAASAEWLHGRHRLPYATTSAETLRGSAIWLFP